MSAERFSAVAEALQVFDDLRDDFAELDQTVARVRARQFDFEEQWQASFAKLSAECAALRSRIAMLEGGV